MTPFAGIFEDFAASPAGRLLRVLLFVLEVADFGRGVTLPDFSEVGSTPVETTVSRMGDSND